MTVSLDNRRSNHVAYAVLITLTCVISAMPAYATKTSAAARNQAIVQHAFDNWARGSNVFTELLASDVRWTIHGSGPMAGTYVGLEHFIAQAAAPLTSRLMSPLIPEVHDIWAVGDAVIIRFDASATTTSGGIYTNQFVWIFRMHEGLVTDAEAFLDLVAYQDVVDNNVARQP
ncbi:nuclear transport factor 2 family protein [Isoalcanivorax indicus]|uniref:nuclear transport factor 2 family protein n=1 Tax=Isoalcanivorax indicus TaxID=2202653 RepID=UPI000DB9D910|nr:nuclear transport factor 2 family protein [Isoalcanivorax indicus]